MGYDGIQFGNRVDNFNERKLHAKVVDNILSSRVYFSRLMGMAKPFSGKTYDYTVKVVDSGLGEYFSGLETLNTAASDTTIGLSFAHAAFTQPIVIPLVDAMANTGPEATIDLGLFKTEEAAAEAVQNLGSVIYSSVGTSNQPLGLEAIVDDGTNYGTYGGQSRSTYTMLKSTVTASGGSLTLTKLATLEDAISAAGIDTETPNINVTTKTIWSLYERLLVPAVRAEYATVGYNALAVRGDSIVKKAELKGGAGFTALTYRGNPVIKDDACTSGIWYMLNERYLEWRGRTMVPDKFKAILEKIDLGTPSTAEGVMAAPSKYHGFFYQKEMMVPNQAGLVARYYVFGQLMSSQPRRHGKLTGVTTV